MMAILPLTGSPTLHAPEPRAVPELARAPSVDTVRPERETRPPAPQTEESQEVQGLRDAARAVRLDLRYVTLPDSQVVIFRLIDPATGTVVREIPPEGLARALADLRERAAAHIDLQA